MAIALRGILVTALAAIASVSPGQTAAAKGQPEREALDRWLARTPGSSAGEVTALREGYVARAIPSRTFYVLRFRLYPVAPPIPEGLSSNNLLVVQSDGSVERILDPGTLETLFRSASAPVISRRTAEDAARAWIRLTEEFHQDGFFHFADPEVVEFRSGGDGIRVSGRTLVLPDAGDDGEIRVRLEFDRAGRFVKASESARVVAGHRPI